MAVLEEEEEEEDEATCSRVHTAKIEVHMYLSSMISFP
jgi:hypothetical protein